MYTEKFELLEAKIRETALLVSQLREEKRHLEQDNAQLRSRLAALEEELQRAREVPGHYAPHLDSLLQQLDSLQQGEERVRLPSISQADESQPPPVVPPQLSASLAPHEASDPFQVGILYEQRGQFEQAIDTYQRLLDREPDNLDVAQRLAFLLEKLNRDAEAASLWDKIWAMRESQTTPRRRWGR